LNRAQEIAYQAFGEPDPERRAQRAREALALSPDCADAYVLLAENTRGRKEVLRLWEQGVAAGERALGEEGFREAAGRFWRALETRPYMRAREGLALALWDSGRRDEAVRHLQEMLRLNPNDNQGLRYTLAGFLLFLDRNDEVAGLLEQFPDEGSATWAYTRAILAFRRQGDTEESRRALKAARKANKHVPAYLTGAKEVPAEGPGYYGHGDENEAAMYVRGSLAGWKDTPGAVAWLRANLRGRARQSEAPQPKGPLALVKNWLNRRLPQEPDVWEADARQMPVWVGRDGEEKVRPWAVLVTSRSHDLVLAHQITDPSPPAALLWDVLVQAMQHPVVGVAHRPLELRVPPGESWESLRPHLEEVGIRMTVGQELPHLGEAFGSMCARVCGEERPALLDMPGVTPEQVGGFHEAAADYFRKAPWKRVGTQAILRVESDRFPGGPFYAVVMGQSGINSGIAVYEDLATLRGLWRSPQEADESARESVAVSVMFSEPWHVPIGDVDATTRHGWKLARPDAYPLAVHKDRGMSMRRPLAWELELLEALLGSVPGVVERRQQDDPTPEEVTVPLVSGPLRLVLSWESDAEGQA
jgi:tetratricopeptide (TPR) repeat protein